jgi:hypothetical protein
VYSRARLLALTPAATPRCVRMRSRMRSCIPYTERHHANNSRARVHARPACASAGRLSWRDTRQRRLSRR